MVFRRRCAGVECLRLEMRSDALANCCSGGLEYAGRDVLPRLRSLFLFPGPVPIGARPAQVLVLVLSAFARTWAPPCAAMLCLWRIGDALDGERVMSRVCGYLVPRFPRHVPEPAVRRPRAGGSYLAPWPTASEKKKKIHGCVYVSPRLGALQDAGAKQAT